MRKQSLPNKMHEMGLIECGASFLEHKITKVDMSLNQWDEDLSKVSVNQKRKGESFQFHLNVLIYLNDPCDSASKILKACCKSSFRCSLTHVLFSSLSEQMNLTTFKESVQIVSSWSWWYSRRGSKRSDHDVSWEIRTQDGSSLLLCEVSCWTVESDGFTSKSIVSFKKSIIQRF